MEEVITLDYGSGGEKTSELISSVLLPEFQNPALEALGDGAVLAGGEKLVFSSDSFVVSPWKFPGGDIGKLCVCGTVNDLCMAGGIPKYLSLSLILEEGFPMESLKEILRSAARTARETGVLVVTGDTKVVERGKGDGIYINTAGIGILRAPGLGKENLREGDAVIVSGSIGCHGAAVMMERAGLAESSGLQSDCRALNELCGAALEAGTVRVMRDPTRGGAATVLNEFVEGTSLGVELDEKAVPVEEAVEAACGLLGLDVFYCACEGRMILAAPQEDSAGIVEALRKLPGGEGASCIGKITGQYPGQVVLKTRLGGKRLLTKLSGSQLPRIC